MKTMLKKFDIVSKSSGKFLIRIYQKTLSLDHSPVLKHLGVRSCIHYPSCSQYTYEAIDKHGLVPGSVMGASRIIRCNPIVKGGYDPVPEHFTLKPNYQDS